MRIRGSHPDWLPAGPTSSFVNGCKNSDMELGTPETERHCAKQYHRPKRSGRMHWAFGRSYTHWLDACLRNSSSVCLNVSSRHLFTVFSTLITSPGREGSNRAVIFQEEKAAAHSGSVGRLHINFFSKHILVNLFSHL